MNVFKSLFAGKPDYQRGFDWAKNALAEGKTVEQIESELDGLPPVEFDRGALDAIWEYENANKLL